MEFPGLFLLPIWLLLFPHESIGGLKRYKPPSVPHLKEFEKWHTLRLNLELNAKTAENAACSASSNLTFAFYLLNDVLDFHKYTGVMNFAWPRHTYFAEQFKPFTEVWAPSIRVMSLNFCSYKEQLVCSNNTCAHCDQDTLELQLKTACELKGDGGRDYQPIDTEKSKDLTTTTPKPTEENCKEDWLYVKTFEKKFYTPLAKPDGQSVDETCHNLPGLQLSFVYLKVFVDKGKDKMEKERRQFPTFWENKLHFFQKDLVALYDVCKYSLDTDGEKLVCGPDNRCINCKNVTEESGGDLVEACAPKKPKKNVKSICDSGVDGFKKLGWWIWMIVGFFHGILRV